MTDDRLSAEDHALVYGHDPTERIVALHPVGQDRMRVYVRPPTGPVTWTDERVHPFFFLTDVARLRGFPRSRFRFQELDGPGAYRYLVVLPDRGAYFDAIRHVGRAAGTQREPKVGASQRPDEVYTVGGPEQQYLTQTGRTLFKGMDAGDVVRLQLDIEVYAPGAFPDADVPEHRVILVALSDSTGWAHLVGAPGVAEADVLRETVRLVQERDPDVIEGHNCFGFDLPYLAARCRRHGVPFALGRDGSEPRTFPSAIRFAERSIEYDAAEIAGRHVVDTMFLAMAYDVFKRDLPNYTLKGVARHFGFAPDDRTYVAGDEIAHVWDSDPDRLMAYALDDAIETERIARHLGGSHFYLAQMVPMPYGTAARTGPAAKIEALFVRGYLHARQALPRPESGSQVVGGYTDVFVTGVVGPVVYADVESLYPSIMLSYGIGPASDALGLHPRLLRVLTRLRLDTKAAMREAPDATTRGELDARQSATKIIINSFYGNMGFGFALFNDFAAADRVAATGQEIVRRMVRHVREAGGTVVEVDTDGVLFVPPPGVDGEAAERAFVAAMGEALPDGIRVGFDGRFERMLSYKKKNYALLGADGQIRLKGSSLVSRSMERFGRQFVREAIRLLLAEDVAGLHALYLDARRRIAAHDWASVESFQRVETLKDSLDRYAADVAEGRRNRSAAYELAAAEAAAGVEVRRGHRVAWYVAAGAGGSARAFESARLARAWDPSAPDEDTAFYLDRLTQFAAKFEPFFETPAMHRAVFSEEDLFGFDAGSVRLAVRVRDPSEADDAVPF